MRILLLLLSSFATFAQSASAADHPGNVFLAGDDVRVTVPKTWAGWRAIDIDRKEVGRSDINSGFADLGELPVGYFEVREKGGPGMVTAAVLAKATISDDTPIAIDVAASWFYSDPQQIHDACKLCRLAGVKWVRDRSSWPEIETARGTWAGDTRYERAMRVQHEEGLKILQVNHISPAWASNDPTHFPTDLRDVYNFYHRLAKRWKGLADAIEPWNEPDIQPFGAHTGCEIASFQKAAYLGLKTSDPSQPVNAAVFAIDRPETLEEFGANEVYPYFDRYDLHHYIKLADFPRAYARHRAVSGGRPMWTTEFNLNIFWSDEKTKELSDDDLRIQAYRISKAFAEALREGPQKAFYFIFGHYVERKIVYGIVHTDLAPRPSYVAFAAVGRLLNATQPIGRIDFGDEKLKGYAFRTEIDGAPRETVVAWSETKPTTVNIGGAEQICDYLGRKLPVSRKVELTRAPIFCVLPTGGSKALTIVPPPAKAKWLDGKPSPVVLQLLGKTDFKKSAFQLDDSKQLHLVMYNFGDKVYRGNLVVQDASCKSPEVAIAPNTREERILENVEGGMVTVRLNLGADGNAVVAARTLTRAPGPQ